RTDTAVFTNIMLQDEHGYVIIPGGGKIDSIEWKAVHGSNFLSGGNLSWNTNTSNWQTENVSTVNFTSEFNFMVTVISHDYWNDNGTRTFIKSFTFLASELTPFSTGTILIVGSSILIVVTAAIILIIQVKYRN
ncbi:MAG: hypothetical protein ACTSP4_09905, partial [Candidatus Hodarchaeales archaeon]